ncbi:MULTISPECIES: type IV toxin-antitoxin system AbiEi family antitoxin [unclassified Flagellimonas]|uniref:Type IV toxin-antitoxin system AbiEi family antitoxin n=1 Tax=Flagellimonas sp. MMG031 TaxID=3158549 RepID=A0AAU7N0Z2_9FLAO
MYRNNDFIYEAVANLENLINIPIDIETSRDNYDAILNIKNMQFVVEAKSAMRTSNQGLVLSQLEEIRNRSNKPIILIAQYISKEAANHLKERGFNYIDIAGNAFVKKGDLVIYIEGQKRRTATLTNQSRAFQEAGVKIIFHLLSEPENLQDSYRTIAQKVGVSLGSVSNVMAELEELNYLIKTNEKRVLKNKEELLERWLVEFNTVLKPRIIRSRMKFIDTDMVQNWRHTLLNQTGRDILWGGESAGAILTDNLRPQEFTIYSNLELPEIAKTLRLVPDKTGNVEVRQKFWQNNNWNQNTVPALLIYTDLMNSGYGRNVEIANQVFENELQHIQ